MLQQYICVYVLPLRLSCVFLRRTYIPVSVYAVRQSLWLSASAISKQIRRMFSWFIVETALERRSARLRTKINKIPFVFDA